MEGIILSFMHGSSWNLQCEALSARSIAMERAEGANHHCLLEVLVDALTHRVSQAGKRLKGSRKKPTITFADLIAF
jgi:hypothetical protein